MAEKVESLNCREGHHLSCPKCPCTCHPRHGREADVWDKTVRLQAPVEAA